MFGGDVLWKGYCLLLSLCWNNRSIVIPAYFLSLTLGQLFSAHSYVLYPEPSMFKTMSTIDFEFDKSYVFVMSSIFKTWQLSILLLAV